MLALGLAASYAPAMFRTPAEWPRIHRWLTGDAPQPRELALETSDIVQQLVERTENAWAALRQRLTEVKPDVLIVLATDLGAIFSRVQIPQLCTYMGETLSGSTRLAELDEKADEDIVEVRCASELSAFLQRELVEAGFDMSGSKMLRPMVYSEFGAGASIVAPLRALMSGLDLPVVPIFVNTHVQPSPSGYRCYELGKALAAILSERDEGVALFCSGGLSHDHHGPRAGWIDEPFDRWALEQLSRGRGSALCPMFDLESDAIQGGAAHLRLWITVAAACEALGSKAQVVDYFPCYSAATGLGFAYWPIVGTAGSSRSSLVGKE